MLAMGIAHRKGERSQALKGCNTLGIKVVFIIQIHDYQIFKPQVQGTLRWLAPDYPY
jgi:hypothetical protein